MFLVGFFFLIICITVIDVKSSVSVKIPVLVLFMSFTALFEAHDYTI